MRVLLFTNNEFPVGETRDCILKWVDEFTRLLRKEGIDVDYFNPYLHKISKTDIVHVFGLTQRENWYWLKTLAHKVIVSPFPGDPLPPFIQKNRISFIFRRLVHFLRILRKKRNITMDDTLYFKSVDKFCVFKTFSLCIQGLPLPIEKLSHESSKAAKEMSKIYNDVYLF